jgi:hypothetical protein
MLRTYEITFRGEAVPAIHDAFQGLDIAVNPGMTTLRAEMMDQAALYGVINRLQELGLELLAVTSQGAVRASRGLSPPSA